LSGTFVFNPNVFTLIEKPYAMHPVITPVHLAKALSYPQYRSLIDTLLAEGKTTGLIQKPVLVEYTALNVVRMNRLDKTTVLQADLQAALDALQRPLLWLVLTEAWCPDSAHCVPVLAKIEERSPRIALKLLMRDENADLMDHFLTNGSRSIPKLICLDAETGEELGTWGPRPSQLQEMVMDHKRDPKGVSHDDFMTEVQRWYAKDKTLSLQHELTQWLQTWNASSRASSSIRETGQRNV
jgi:hypothetical protein